MSRQHHQHIPSTTNKPRNRLATTAHRQVRPIDRQTPVSAHNRAIMDPKIRVTVMFTECSQTFLAPECATLEDIADRVDQLGARHEQAVVAVVIKFADRATHVLHHPLNG